MCVCEGASRTIGVWRRRGAVLVVDWGRRAVLAGVGGVGSVDGKLPEAP